MPPSAKGSQPNIGGQKSPRRGFSLMELMVVVAIVIVLASMTLVGFSRAQSRAKAAMCMNNLRQIGTLVISYAAQKGGGFLPNFSITGPRGYRELWVLELDFLDEEDRYWAKDHAEKIVPPRLAPPVLRCPIDVQPFVNSQSVLTSYWMHPENSQKALASITNQDKTILSFEGDPLHVLRPCRCRFKAMFPPEELDTTHFGGGHILFVNGAVELFTSTEERRRVTWERRAGWDPEKIKEKYSWPRVH